MRFVNVAGRLNLAIGVGDLLDVEQASGGVFPADPAAAFMVWDELVSWARTAADPLGSPVELAPDPGFGPPSPRPRQVFAIGLNYREHAAEAGARIPEAMQTFTKFPSALVGPYADVQLPSDSVDWEVELVVVIGRTAYRVGERHAWDFVAGLTIGQDYSERDIQLTGEYPQYSLAKSFPGFGPTGPVLVTPDEFIRADDLAIECYINDELVQSARTSEMIHGIPALIANLSAVCVLYPGDLIFTGTPSGVGVARDPKRFLTHDDVVTSRIEGIGEMRQRAVGQRAAG